MNLLNDDYDKIMDSIELSKRKISQSLHQSKLQEISKNQTSRRFTMQMDDNSENSNSLKQRLIAAHLLKDLIPLDNDNDDQACPMQKIYKSQPIQNPKKQLIILGTTPHKYLKFYIKTMETLNMQDVQNANEILIQNTLIAGKFVNNYGLFCLIKELMAKKNIKILIHEDVLTDVDGNLMGTTNSIKFHKGLTLQDIHYTMGIVSLLKFRVNFKLTLSHYILYKEQLKQLEIIIKKNLQNSEDILFLCADEKSVEFTIPNFNDSQCNQFISSMKSSEFEIIFLPLITHITLRMSDLNPWCNREINKQWKMFALQSNKQEVKGYMDFYSPTIYNEIPVTKTLKFKLYGEIQNYQIAARISEDEVTGILIKDQNI